VTVPDEKRVQAPVYRIAATYRSEPAEDRANDPYRPPAHVASSTVY